MKRIGGDRLSVIGDRLGVDRFKDRSLLRTITDGIFAVVSLLKSANPNHGRCP